MHAGATVNIGIIFSPPRDYRGGSQIQFFNDLIPEIQKLNSKTIIFSKYGDLIIISEKNSEEILELKYKLSKGEKFHEFIKEECRKRSITHIYYPYHNEFVGKIDGITQVITVHDMSPYNYPFSIPIALLKWVFKFKGDVSRADRVITVSEFSKREIVKHLKINPNLITVIPNGVKSKIKIIENCPKKYITYIASSSYSYKNILKLIFSFNKIVDKIPFDLIIVAKSSHRRNILLFISKFLKGKSKIKFFSNLTEDEISELYNHTAMVVYPSLYEGFGLPILEAMQYNIPILASNRASIPEVGCDACHYIDARSINDISNGILNIYNGNSDVIHKLSLQKVVLNKYSWKKTAMQILSILNPPHEN